MALLDGWTGKAGYTGPDNKVEYELANTFSVYQGTEMVAVGVYKLVFYDITRARYHYVGMDKTTAAACATVFNNPDLGVNARPVKSGQGPAYHVEVDVYIAVRREED